MPEVSVKEAERFMVESLVAGGAPLSEAKAHADLLLHADFVGHFSHGMNRLGKNVPKQYFRKTYLRLHLRFQN